MSDLEDRKNAFENKFAHDAEIEFKVGARRNKLVGLWAAQKLGKTGAEAEAYAREVVMADLETTGNDDLTGKLLKDFGGAGLAVQLAEIEGKLQELLPVARKQIMEAK